MDEAMSELVRQAELKAGKLENGAGVDAPGTCPAHAALASGVACSLRLLVVLARREAPPRRLTWTGVGVAAGGILSGLVAYWRSGGKVPSVE